MAQAGVCGQAEAEETLKIPCDLPVEIRTGNIPRSPHSHLHLWKIHVSEARGSGLDQPFSTRIGDFTSS